MGLESRLNKHFLTDSHVAAAEVINNKVAAKLPVLLLVSLPSPKLYHPVGSERFGHSHAARTLYAKLLRPT